MVELYECKLLIYSLIFNIIVYLYLYIKILLIFIN